MTIDFQKQDHIAVITINRPEVMNAMNMQTMLDLRKVLVEFRDDPDLWVSILTGAGEKAFCAGADLSADGAFSQQERQKNFLGPMYGLDLWKPIIAAVNGLALGGGFETMLECDIRIASEKARFGQTEVRWALMPGGGGTQRLPRELPWCKAAEIVFMGKLFDAQEAFRIGLINKIVPLEQLMPTSLEWAKAICENGPLGVRKSKEAMFKGSAMSLNEGIKLEHALFETIQQTEDFQEGIKAFKEKRKPNYKGK
jgi:E-phenylitaconyl-CoA hydratase